MIKFSQLTDSIQYLPRVQAVLSTAHAAVVTYVMNNFQNTQRFKTQVMKVINNLTYSMFVDMKLPDSWNEKDPLKLATYVDDDTCKAGSANMYVYLKDIEWDVTPVVVPSGPVLASTPVVDTKPVVISVDVAPPSRPADKTDLYLRPPTFPQFDVNKIWAGGVVDGEPYVIYSTLPEIPEIQNQISVSTDVNRMTRADVMKLYPSEFIQTRAAEMYEDVVGLTRHPVLGVILPIEGYSQAQLIDNLIKYPHFYKLMKETDSGLDSFYSTIEINGELQRTLTVWDELPESKKIPKTAQFIKEYVIRRYLLERDYGKVTHRYPLYGKLDPFLTLFAPADTYAQLGYTDSEAIARQCVQSRVSFKQSRNPLLRRLSDE